MDDRGPPLTTSGIVLHGSSTEKTLTSGHRERCWQALWRLTAAAYEGAEGLHAP